MPSHDQDRSAVLIRQLHYLIALARERHFARAAEVCHVSQPALSAAIKQLESEFGISIIRRGQRFQGLTPEGEKLLVWARRIAALCEGMAQEAASLRGGRSGVIRLGAIPTTLPVVPLLTEPSMSTYLGVRFKVQSLSAEKIILGLDDYELDMGLTYLEDQRLQGFDVLPLYHERYVLLSRDDSLLGGRNSLNWAEVAEFPLCLLTPEMQNRRIIDAAFRRAGIAPRPVVETDSIFALYSHVRLAGLCAIVPHSMLCLFEMRQEVNVVPLEPELARPIGLIALHREPLPPLLPPVWAIMQTLQLQPRFDALISALYRP